MEAPEKIWMTDEWVRQFDDKDFMGEDNIEYTRTDVFIEKACNYLQKNMWRIILEENEFRQRFVTDFENYMKGK